MIENIIPERGRKPILSPNVRHIPLLDWKHNPREGTETVAIICLSNNSSKIENIIPERGRKLYETVGNDFIARRDWKHNPREGTETPLFQFVVMFRVPDWKHNPREGTETRPERNLYRSFYFLDWKHNPREGTETSRKGEQGKRNLAIENIIPERGRKHVSSCFPYDYCSSCDWKHNPREGTETARQRQLRSSVL